MVVLYKWVMSLGYFEPTFVYALVIWVTKNCFTNNAKLTVISLHTVQYYASAISHLVREKMQWKESVTRWEVLPGTLILLGSKQKLVSSTFLFHFGGMLSLLVTSLNIQQLCVCVCVSIFFWHSSKLCGPLHFLKLNEKTSLGPSLTSVIVLFPLTHWPVVSKTYLGGGGRGGVETPYSIKWN